MMSILSRKMFKVYVYGSDHSIPHALNRFLVMMAQLLKQFEQCSKGDFQCQFQMQPDVSVLRYTFSGEMRSTLSARFLDLLVGNNVFYSFFISYADY